jgi:hypothetical protein
MGRLKNHALTLEELEIQIREVMYPNEDHVWFGNQGKRYLIEAMDFQHLENVVNLVSNGMVIHPHRQGSFENVMLRYLRLQAQINDVHKEIL